MTLACGPNWGEDGGSADQEEGPDTGLELGTWEEIYCAPLDSPAGQGAYNEVCYGVPALANIDNGLLLVEPECLLDYRARVRGFQIVDAFQVDCAAGAEPASSFEEQLCILDPDGLETGCYAGSDGWFTRIEALCTLDDYLGQDLESCNSTAVHPDDFWDEVQCGSTVCAGISGNTYVPLARGKLDSCTPELQRDYQLLESFALACHECEGDPGSQWCECDGSDACDEGLMCLVDGEPWFSVATPHCEPLLEP